MKNEFQKAQKGQKYQFRLGAPLPDAHFDRQSVLYERVMSGKNLSAQSLEEPTEIHVSAR